MKYVPIDKVKPGMIMASSIYDNREQVLIRANEKLTTNNIKRITKLGYTGVYILEDDNVSMNPPIISEFYRIKAVQSLKKLSVDDCVYVANEIVKEVTSLRTIVVEVLQLSSIDGYTFTHGVNVCAFSIVIGIGLGLKSDELKALAQAALLHDIGKLAIDPDILNKPAKLTDEEYEEIKRHVVYGTNILKKNSGISEKCMAGVYQHHENEDGSGYPQGLTGEKIHLFGKIIHIADVYDALTAKRCYKEAMNPTEALEYLATNAGTLFDKDVVQVFMKYVAPYPVGSVVELSDGNFAIVYKNNSDCLDCPVVKLDSGRVIDLKEERNLTITGMKC